MRAPAFWNQTHGRAAAPLTRTLLLPISWAYAAIANWRYGKVKPEKLSVPVLCIGNISLGGTGKTPLALALAQALIVQGKNPAFITRGHGGSEVGPTKVDPARHGFADVGDEALLLAEIAPVFVGRDRLAAAKAAIATGAGCLIMDDGFQNPTLHKDLSILVIDSEVGHGNGRVFPAGPLREPVQRAVNRADAIVIVSAHKMRSTDKTPDLANFSGPVFRAQLTTPDQAPTGDLVAFAGIGRPQKFFSSLQAKGANLVQELAFADHHPYRPKDVVNILAWKQHSKIRLITTAKDLVRWPKNWRKEVLVWPVELVFDPPADSEQILQEILLKCQ